MAEVTCPTMDRTDYIGIGGGVMTLRRATARSGRTIPHEVGAIMTAMGRRGAADFVLGHMTGHTDSRTTGTDGRQELGMGYSLHVHPLWIQSGGRNRPSQLDLLPLLPQRIHSDRKKLLSGDIALSWALNILYFVNLIDN